jgi:hypothetical protein
MGCTSSESLKIILSSHVHMNLSMREPWEHKGTHRLTRKDMAKNIRERSCIGESEIDIFQT